VLAAGFAELAAQLGARDVLDTRDPVASVHGLLAAFPAGWLLIFDNAADMASVAASLPPAGPGRVLITSQNPHWSGRLLEVSVLDPEVAAGYLASRTGDPDLQAAGELAGELGGLPLALEQAAAYIQATVDSLAGYLALFRHRRAGLLARGQPAGYSKTVASTWVLAFDRLRHTRPGAVGLLRLLAFARPKRSRCACCCNPALGWRSGSARRWQRRWCRCWRMSWQPRTRSPRCAGTRWSPWPPADRCRCTGWSRPSPRIRCRPSWPPNGGMLLLRSSRTRFPAIPSCLEAGRPARRCCRTPRRHWPMTAMGWPGLPVTSDRAAVTLQPKISSA
jgi:hypothetical protein